MKTSKLIALLMILVLFSLHFLSPTLARFSDEYRGSDVAVIGKWNFRVGSVVDNLQNQGFTFDVFDGQNLSPQMKSSNSFFISPGESDVAIDYEVTMNVAVLMKDINGNQEGEDYPPLIFKIESNENLPTVNSTATIPTSYGDGFSLKDIEVDDDGYFTVATGNFEAGSDEIVEITINWWWNTSYYEGTPPSLNHDSTSGGNYYKLATDDYQILINNHNYAVAAANNFFDIHERIVSNVDGVDQISYVYNGSGTCPYTPPGGDEAHISAHNSLVAAVSTAQNAINNSLKVAYDKYDTKALGILNGLQSNQDERIMFRVVGEQVPPEKI